jgi:murein DD-endopeptidase MepM/ murein hydrolase activator NlpD
MAGQTIQRKGSTFTNILRVSYECLALQAMECPLSTILRKYTPDFSPVVPFDWDQEKGLLLDLTEANPDLHQLDLRNTAAFTHYVFGKMAQAGVRVAVGGYNENRYIYRRSAHFNSPDEARSVHLGIDVWAVAGTEVCAPLSGRVHSFRHNDHFGDYGPTLILEHELEGIPFYTLYGHLSLASLDGLYEGREISQGTQLAEIGDEAVNGSWPPHLHFQVIRDMGGYRGDSPGVCKPSERAVYLQRCPDPNLILGIKQLSR